MYEGNITDIIGLQVGHASDFQAKTGCTVVICREGTIGGVEVRGGAPGTRETDVLKPGNLVSNIHAVFLAGGSAFGLDAGGGVMRFLEENAIGYDTGGFKVPIVSGAVIYDLNVGNGKIRPDSNMGYQACLNASIDNVFEQGRIGAGTGATLGKAFGSSCMMYGGVGCASLRLSCGATVAALMVVNAMGDVIDYKTGKILAGAYDREHKCFLDSQERFKNAATPSHFSAINTTIGVVATDAIMTKAEANRLAAMGQNGIAWSIRPSHMLFDGDTVYGLSTCKVEGEINAVYAAAQEVTAMAIANAAMTSNKDI